MNTTFMVVSGFRYKEQAEEFAKVNNEKGVKSIAMQRGEKWVVIEER